MHAAGPGVWPYHVLYVALAAEPSWHPRACRLAPATAAAACAALLYPPLRGPWRACPAAPLLFLPPLSLPCSTGRPGAPEARSR
eukprot:851656-Pelagomonas_calceolata.AAC.2